MKVKYKKLKERAVTPFKKHAPDAGFDLTATWTKVYPKYTEYGTDLAFETPEGYVGFLFPRSSVRNQDLILKNSVGVLDATYRGEVKFSFYNLEGNDTYSVGERCGQIVFIKLPDVELVEAEELSETNRGAGGYGSSGK